MPNSIPQVDPPPHIQDIPQAPSRLRPDDFNADAERFFPALTRVADEQNAALDWANLTFQATEQSRQMADASAQAAADSEAAAAQSAQESASSASSSADSAAQSGARRDEAQFWAEQAADAVGLPALAGNASHVLTVNDDETAFEWKRPTIAVEVSLDSAAQTAAGYDWEITASGVSRHAGGSISQFIIEWPDGVRGSAAATAGSATFTRQVNEPEGATVTARGWAIDDAGNMSLPVQVSAQVVGNRPPEGPITINAPTQIGKNAEFRVSMSGATDPDGDPVTYEITDAGMFTFAKTTGITESEIVEVTAPNVADDTDVAFTVRAIDDKGGTSPAQSKTITVLAAQVVGVEMTATGGPGGVWNHIDEAGNSIATPTKSWFDSHPVWGGMQDVVVDGQQMVEVPKFYYQFGTSAAGNPARWISDQPLAGFTIMPAFELSLGVATAFQVGKYQASESGGKLQSIPGVKPLVSATLTDFIAKAMARNAAGVAGFRLWHYDMWLAIQWLYVVEHATMDSQTKTGEGRVNASSAANVDAADVAQATYRGIVGLWGNVWQWMDGVRTNGNVIERRAYDAAGWPSTGENAPNGGSTQYPITFRLTGDEQFIADTFSTSNDNTATLPDYRRWRTGGTYYPVVGGSWGYGANAGLWCVHCDVSASYSSSGIGGRLARIVS